MSPSRAAISAVAALALAADASLLGAADWPLRIVTVARVAEVRPRGGAEWKPASLRAEIGPGDTVRTIIPGRVTLVTPSGQSLRLAPQTRLALGEDSAPDGPTRARLETGWLWLAVLPGAPSRESFEIDAGPVAVTVRDGGIGVMRNPDGSVTVRAYHGAAECVGTGVPRWARPLTEGQELIVSAAGPPDKVQPITRGKPEADWVKVNADQDLAGGYGAPAPKK